ncbi:N-acetylmuramoyl-L-alanine amidase [Aureibaculum sp. 2210JD6-5]|uniref:N-acetylmuramoyl-L-alanine amidase family protein n=1 Tax=Aureibaculum sp. 2210JD6-5 TaxID=3103957 RepID=UPI002AAD45F0|nr:N-acetylmuramoyl-L-alanine amidase [Aureibaculum sp. 2210JD6-5]MDY7393784.1 N-acetylmuramoyl-L-alanine amidase [Aureibaculum sp. 2210JD6-5]
MNTLLCKITIKKLFFLSFLLIVGLQSFTVSAQEKFKVVIDAGHGGTDPGNLGNGYFEKDIVLKIALEVGKLLKADKSIEVIYTRDDDTFIELHERGTIAQKSKADLFVSIHCDAFGQSSVHGAGTFVLGLHENDRNFEIAKKENSVILLEDNYKENYDGFDPNSPEAVIGLTLMQEEYLDQSLTLASLIQTNFANDLKRKDRMVKQAGFLVLRNTFMPSVLVETGFLTNKAEGAYLNSKKGQQEIAKSIYKAIKSYKKQMDANTVVEVKPKEKPKEDTTPKTRIVKGIDFKVQISSSPKKVNTASYNFKGLKGVERVRIGAHHKYYYGKTSDYLKIKELQKEAKAKGFAGAFVVAFKNERKISVKDALASK